MFPKLFRAPFFRTGVSDKVVLGRCAKPRVEAGKREEQLGFNGRGGRGAGVVKMETRTQT